MNISGMFPGDMHAAGLGDTLSVKAETEGLMLEQSWCIQRAARPLKSRATMPVCTVFPHCVK